MCLKVQSLLKLLKKGLNLSKTETNILWLLWDLKSKRYKSTMNTNTNPGEENLFVDTTLVHKGISVKELQELLNLRQPTIYKALETLRDRKYVTREKVQKTYRYRVTTKAYRDFQTQLVRYQQGLEQLIRPFVENDTPTLALNEVRRELRKRNWQIQGWQEVAGFQNFVVKQTHAKAILSKHDLAVLQQDVLGQNITPEMTQIHRGDTLVIRSVNSHTSPFHLESNMVMGLWTVQNRPTVKTQTGDFVAQLAGTEG